MKTLGKWCGWENNEMEDLDGFLFLWVVTVLGFSLQRRCSKTTWSISAASQNYCCSLLLGNTRPPSAVLTYCTCHGFIFVRTLGVNLLSLLLRSLDVCVYVEILPFRESLFTFRVPANPNNMRDGSGTEKLHPNVSVKLLSLIL
jgi:hypothetical protein